MRRRRTERLSEPGWAQIAEFRSRRSTTEYRVWVRRTDGEAACECKVFRQSNTCTHLSRVTKRGVLASARAAIEAENTQKATAEAVVARQKAETIARLRPAITLIVDAIDRACRVPLDVRDGAINTYNYGQEWATVNIRGGLAWAAVAEELLPFLVTAGGKAVARRRDAAVDQPEDTRGVRVIVFDEDE
jgi:hypothetical protein